MATFERTFTMQEAPEQAQARFRNEIGPALHRMAFRLDKDQAGHLAFGVRYVGGRIFWLLPWTLWFTSAFWLWRKAVNQCVEVDFSPDTSGTKVELYGRTGADIRDLIYVLGRRGHWPENAEDPDWLPESSEDRFSEWNEAGEVDPREMDRITRRALKKARRLP
jgi:hypothetical protein